MAQEKLMDDGNTKRSSLDKVKNFFNDSKKKFNERVTMDGLLAQARESFEQFLNPKIVPIEQRISDKLMRDAHGIVFITEVKGSVLFGMKAGTGIIITRNEDNELEWSGPIAICTGGASFGFQFGVSKIDHIIILPSPNHVKTFLGKGQLQLKANASAAVAKYGRDGNVGVGVGNKDGNVAAAPIISYSFGAKGLYAGVCIDGTILTPRNECNASFYGKKVTLKQIINGQVEAPHLNDDYKKIIQLLNTKNAVEYNNDPVVSALKQNDSHTIGGLDDVSDDQINPGAQQFGSFNN